MTLQQMLALAVIALMMGVFVWGRFRYDIVALSFLLFSVALGLVPYDVAFSGFSDDIVIIVGSALIVSAAVARSGMMEAVVQRFAPKLNAVHLQMFVLVGAVTVLSAFVKNVGALAILIPIAIQFARRSKVSPSVFLMPMAFGALLGGLMTQVGTSPNIVVSRVRAEMVGESFTMFDFTPVGATLAVVGIIYLSLFYWLVPQRKREQVNLNEAIEISDYISEAKVTKTATVIGKKVTDVVKPAEGSAMITSIIRAKKRVAPLPDTIIAEGDVIMLQGDPKALDAIVSNGKLQLSEDRGPADKKSGAAEIEALEAVIGKNSPLIGTSARKLNLYENYEVNLLAVSREGERINQRLGEVVFRQGDVVVLQGLQGILPPLLKQLGCLPLARRTILLGSVRRGLIPLSILLAAIIVTAFGVVPVSIAFFGAAVAMIVFRALPLSEVYSAIDGPILIMLAALIPVSDALRTTGATDVIAHWLTILAQQMPPSGALALILITAMLVTPFLNNAATVLVMAPIATSFAAALGFKPEAFLMAVAIGAGCDFLSPVGHQCNTLVMGPGGYRFSDYPRLGLPLSFLIVLVAIPTLMFWWPLT